MGFRGEGRSLEHQSAVSVLLNLFQFHSDMTAWGTTGLDSSMGLEITGHLQFVIVD